MLHFTPLAWVRNDNTPPHPPSCPLCGEKNVYQRQMLREEGEIRSAKCPSVEVRKTSLVTHDHHDLMRKREKRGDGGYEEGKRRHMGRVSGRDVVRSDYWV